MPSCTLDYSMLGRFKFGAVLFVMVAVTAAPALNCLSFMEQMSMQQMACCKHMTDDCDMGTGQQSCCGHGGAQTLRATLPDKVVHVQPAMVAGVVAADILQTPRTAYTAPIQANDGSPPLQPPGSITVLRT